MARDDVRRQLELEGLSTMNLCRVLAGCSFPGLKRGGEAGVTGVVQIRQRVLARRLQPEYLSDERRPPASASARRAARSCRRPPRVGQGRPRLRVRLVRWAARMRTLEILLTGANCLLQPLEHSAALARAIHRDFIRTLREGRGSAKRAGRSRWTTSCSCSCTRRLRCSVD